MQRTRLGRGSTSPSPGTSSAYEGIRRRLQARCGAGKVQGGGLFFFCPLHDDRRRPNLQLRAGRGKAHLHCFVCNDRSPVWLNRLMAELGLETKHLYDDRWSGSAAETTGRWAAAVSRRPRSPKKARTRARGHVPVPTELPQDHPWFRTATEMYPYRATEGDPPAGVLLKWAGKQRARRALVRPTDQGLIAGIRGGRYWWWPRHQAWRRVESENEARDFSAVELPFYRWHQAREEAGTVYWCGGEKDSEWGAAIGWRTVAHYGGEGHYRDSLVRQLAGETVVIVFDADPAGEAGAGRVQQALHQVGVQRTAIVSPDLLSSASGGNAKRGFDLSDLVKGLLTRLGSPDAVRDHLEEHLVARLSWRGMESRDGGEAPPTYPARSLGPVTGVAP